MSSIRFTAFSLPHHPIQRRLADPELPADELMIDAVEHPPDAFIAPVLIGLRDVNRAGILVLYSVDHGFGEIARQGLLHAERNGCGHDIVAQLVEVVAHSGMKRLGCLSCFVGIGKTPWP